MKCVILTAGTMGDVVPFVALGKGLVDAGHKVTICTHVSFRRLITEHRLTYGYMGDELLKFIGIDAVQDIIKTRSGVIGLVHALLELSRQMKPGLRQMLKEEWAAAQGAEVVIYNPQAFGGQHIAEKLNVPGFMSVPYPVVPTRAFPFPVFPALKLGGWYNRLTYAVIPLGMALYRGVINSWRKKVLGLPRRPLFDDQMVQADGQPILGMLCYSPHILPVPDDWPDTVVTTGYWFLDCATDWQPPADLVEFLAAGPPPVYVGFGSMVGSKPARLARIVQGALEQLGQRGVIAIGWKGTATSLPENVFQIESVPHNWLFPRMAAVVHHGGAGTTGAGLRAGRPTVICPFVGDQPFWGRRVHELGVGPKPIPKKKLTIESLADAMREAIRSERIRQSAADLGAKIRAEDGVARAVEFIHKHTAAPDQK